MDSQRSSRPQRVTAGAEGGHSAARLLATRVFAPESQSLAATQWFVDKWAGAVGLGKEPTRGMRVAVGEACTSAVEDRLDKSDITLMAWGSEDRFTIDVCHAGEFRATSSQGRGQQDRGLPLMVASVDEVTFFRLPEGGTRVSVCVFLR